MFRAGGEWSFPDKRRFVKRGFERPLNGNKKRKAPPATPPPRLNAATMPSMPSLSRPRKKARRSAHTRGINSSSPARPIGPKPTKFTYLREPLFFPTSPIQRRITVLRLIVPSPTHPFAHCRLPSTPPPPTR